MTFSEVKEQFLPLASFGHDESIMVPSATGYLFLLVIGFLSLAATVAVAATAYRRRHARKSGQARAWH
jgi:hypothetical protein